MMNLLIGMLSETLAEVLENKERNDYYELCYMVLLLENLMFWKFNKTDSQCSHLIFAQYESMESEWDGRVKATTEPIKTAVNTLDDKLTKAITE